MDASLVLKGLRDKHGLSIYALSKGSGVSQRMIKSYLYREKKPSTVTAVKLAEYFNVSVDYILGRAKDYSEILEYIPAVVPEPTMDLSYLTSEIYRLNRDIAVISQRLNKLAEYVTSLNK